MRAIVVVLSFALLTGCPPTEPDPPEPPPVTLPFPDDFLWGTATAQWQSEGDEGFDGPVDSNWRRWTLMGLADAEQTNPDGNGFRTQYADEARRAAELGLTRFRLGIDWSRVEPAPGEYDDRELDHLVDVLDAFRAEGVEPVLTLWHWVVPPWVQNPDGDAPEGTVDLMASTNPDARDLLRTRWEAFVRRVAARVKDRVDIYTVLNEPLTVVSAGYIAAEHPPGRLLDVDGAVQFGVNIAYMQAIAYDVLHELDDVDADGDGDPAFVGMTMTASRFDASPADDEDLQFAAESISYVFNDWLMQALVDGNLDVDLDQRFNNEETNPPEGTYSELMGRLDFIGVQYYGPTKVGADPLLREFHPLYGRPLYQVFDHDERLPHSGTGTEIDASGYRWVLEHYAQWGLPIILTESGTTTNLAPPRDSETAEPGAPAPEQAAMYLMEHLWEVARLIDEGADIRGYFMWTLSDNFEWNDGTKQRFGAYGVDFDDDARPRTLTPLGEAYAEVVGANQLDATIWNKWILDAYPSDRRPNPAPTTSDEVSWAP